MIPIKSLSYHQPVIHSKYVHLIPKTEFIQIAKHNPIEFPLK